MKKQNFSDFIVRMFYALSICVAIRGYNIIARNSLSMEKVEWLWPAHWFSYFSYSSERLLFVYLYVISSFFLVIFLPRFLVLRLNGVYAWLVFLALICCNGKIDHTLLGWPVMAAFLLLFWPSQQYRERFYIHLMQCYIFSNYFAAGLWKARTMTESEFLKEPMLMLKKILLDQIAYGVLETSQESIIIFNFLAKYQYLSLVGWVGVVLLQLGSIFGLFYSDKPWFWGTLFISFHLGTQLVLGVTFYEHTILLIYLFYFLPSIKLLFDENRNIKQGVV